MKSPTSEVILPSSFDAEESNSSEYSPFEESLFQKALKKIQDDHIIEAMDLLDQVLYENPQLAEACYQKGKIYLQLAEYQSAIDFFSKSLEINSYSVEALEARCDAYLKQGAKKKAEEDYQKIIELYPEKQEELSQRFYALYTEPSESQELKMLLNLEKKQQDLQKKIKLQQTHLLNTRFSTEKIIQAIKQIETEKSKIIKILTIDRNRSFILGLGNDTQFIDRTTETDFVTDIPELHEEQNQRDLPKKQEFDSLQILLNQQPRFQKKIVWMKEVFWMLLVCALLIWYFYYSKQPSTTSKIFLTPIHQIDYLKWQYVLSTFLEIFPTAARSPRPPKNFLDWAEEIGAYKGALQASCSQHQYLLHDFLKITRSFGQVQSYLQEKKKVEKEIQKLTKILKKLKKQQLQRKEEADRLEQPIPQFEEELFLKEIERFQQEFERQESLLRSRFSENFLNPVLKANLEFYFLNQEKIDTLWKSFLKQWPSQNKNYRSRKGKR